MNETPRYDPVSESVCMTLWKGKFRHKRTFGLESMPWLICNLSINDSRISNLHTVGEKPESERKNKLLIKAWHTK